MAITVNLDGMVIMRVIMGLAIMVTIITTPVFTVDIMAVTGVLGSTIITAISIAGGSDTVTSSATNSTVDSKGEEDLPAAATRDFREGALATESRGVVTLAAVGSATAVEEVMDRGAGATEPTKQIGNVRL